MDETYRLSRFVRKLEKNGYTALFNGLTLKKAYLSSELFRSALQEIAQPYRIGRNAVADRLIHAGFLVTADADRALFDKIRASVGKIDISNVRLLISNGCNFRCSYCQIEENMAVEQQQYNMTIDVAQKAMDLFEKNSRDDVKKTVTMTGGEPLMNLPAVKYVIERAENIRQARVVIFTNGSLVTEALARYFAGKNVLMLVSLDGTREMHDAVRKKKGGQGTFDVSLRGYRRLKKAGCEVGISAVSGTHNEGRMKEMADFFLEIDPPSIGLNFGHHLLGKPNPSALPMGRFADVLIDFYVRMRHENIFVENISRFITPFYQEKPRFNECQAQGRGLTVDSRGKIGVCKSLLVADRVAMDIDQIPEDLSSVDIFKRFAARSPFTMKQCAECNVIGVCGGGCTYDSFAVNNGDITKIDPRVCDYAHKIADFLIWDLFDGIQEKVGDGVYIPEVKEQEAYYLRFYDSDNALQRSVGHEKDR